MFVYVERRFDSDGHPFFILHTAIGRVADMIRIFVTGIWDDRGSMIIASRGFPYSYVTQPDFSSRLYEDFERGVNFAIYRRPEIKSTPSNLKTIPPAAAKNN
jgi:hypothetical protein